MADLSIMQIAILDRADKRGHILLGDEDTCPGIHFCPDWDGMAVCADSPEAEGCHCGRLSPSPEPQGQIEEATTGADTGSQTAVKDA